MTAQLVSAEEGGRDRERVRESEMDRERWWKVNLVQALAERSDIEA